MIKKMKQKILNYFRKYNQENNKNNNIKINYYSSISSIKTNNLYLLNKIKKKSNYFNSQEKKKQNKELIKLTTISEKLTKPLISKILDKKNDNFYSQSISTIKLLNIYLIGLKILNNKLLSYIKFNPLKTIFINKNNLIKLELEKKEKEKLENKNENFNVINVRNKPKSTILLFISKLKQIKKSENILSKITSLNQKKENKLIIQKNIRKYINSKTTFNSKIAKIFTTSNNYKFYKYNQISNPIKKNIYEFLYKSFISMFTIISKPVYILTPEKIVIQFFYLILKKETINNNIKSLLIIENNNKLKNICKILTCFFKKPVELDLIRLYFPYYNANILVNYIGMFINKIQLRRIVKKFISKSIKNISTNNSIINKSNQLISSKLTGIKIKVAGRLLTQRIIPRRTVKIISSGAISRGKSMFIETARFTNKNKRGAFSLTVSLGHKLNNTIENPLNKNQVRNFHTSTVKFKLTNKER